jgi:hypothetical protein
MSLLTVSLARLNVGAADHLMNDEVARSPEELDAGNETGVAELPDERARRAASRHPVARTRNRDKRGGLG